MDPVTALGLACNVVQLVQLCFDCVGKCRSIYKQGATPENDDLEKSSKQLIAVHDLLKGGLGACQSFKRLQKDDNDLLHLGKQCSETAGELCRFLTKLRSGTRPGSKRLVIVQAFRLMWNEDEIRSLEKKLEVYRKTLDTRLLVNLRQRSDLLAIQQDAGFERLDASIQVLVTSLAASRRMSIDELSRTITDQSSSTVQHVTQQVNDLKLDIAAESSATRQHVADQSEKLKQTLAGDCHTTRQHVTQESQSLTSNLSHEGAAIRQHVTQEIQDLKLNMNDEIKRKEYLKSLYFSEIHSREEIISDKEAHTDTCQWMFDESGRAVRPWSNFVEWLKRGNGPYWINGKAGSGKSTLMYYVCSDMRTRKALEDWAAGRKLLIPTYYFWKPGSTMQKSTLGLLRSLLYQALEACPQLQHSFIQAQIIRDGIPSWTQKRLLTTLQALISQNQFPIAWCFFIDGLDEFDGDFHALIQLILHIVTLPNVKFCLSSRPERAFEHSFVGFPQLRLQDLTRSDIERYARDELGQLIKDRVSGSATAEQFDDLVQQVVQQSSGVFLWVTLAIKSLRQGMLNEDTISELTARLDTLPPEIEDLYVQMLSPLQSNKAYKEEASLYFGLALSSERRDDNFDRVYDRDLKVLECGMARHEKLDAILAGTSPVPSCEELDATCRTTKMRLLTRCMGLLEVLDNTGENCREDSDKDSGEDVDEAGGDDAQEGVEDDEGDLSENTSESEPSLFDQNRDYWIDQILKRKVTFLHRSAYDFLTTNESGKALVLPNCLVHLAKAMLGVAISIPEFDDCTNKLSVTRTIYHNDIISLLRLAEGASGRAELILLDQIYRRFSLTVNSFLVAPHCIHLLDEPQTAFAAFAAKSGLIISVQKMLDNWQGLLGQDILNFLLAWTLEGRDWNNEYSILETDDAAMVQLVQRLLQYGADPNSDAEWVSSRIPPAFHEKNERTLFTTFAMRHPDLFHAFSDAGANLHEKVKREKEHYFGPADETYVIGYSLSTLYAVQYDFQKSPELRKHEQICRAQGVVSEAWIDCILFKDKIKHVDGSKFNTSTRAHDPQRIGGHEGVLLRVYELMPELFPEEWAEAMPFPKDPGHPENFAPGDRDEEWCLETQRWLRSTTFTFE